MSWPPFLPVVGIRIARPTNRLDEVVRFYRDGVGLRVLGGFEDHAGYSGVMLGLPDRRYHLEFTTRTDGRVLPPPSPDHLLVFYVEDAAAIDTLVERLAGIGYHAAAPLNPYWATRGVTVPDPDGWRIVLADSTLTPRL